MQLVAEMSRARQAVRCCIHYYDKLGANWYPEGRPIHSSLIIFDEGCSIMSIGSVVDVRYRVLHFLYLQLYISACVVTILIVFYWDYPVAGLILSCISTLNHEILRNLFLTVFFSFEFKRGRVTDGGCHACPERAIERVSLNFNRPICTRNSVPTMYASIVCAVNWAAIAVAFISCDTRVSWYVIVVTEYFIRLLHTLWHRHF